MIIGETTFSKYLEHAKSVPVDKTPIPKFKKGDVITITDYDPEMHKYVMDKVGIKS